MTHEEFTAKMKEIKEIGENPHDAFDGPPSSDELLGFWIAIQAVYKALGIED